MAWVSKDKNCGEWIFAFKPKRCKGDIWNTYDDEAVQLPKGSIKKLIGRELTWSDEPVELKEDKDEK